MSKFVLQKLKLMRFTLLAIIFFNSLMGLANDGSSEIYVNLQKLHSLKRVLYVAAHPDDENTRAIAWFSLGEKAETAYFSLTRGDGGQNLIGNELSENLGVLRTQELLAARSYDGGKQYFSRAVDFGYSKSAEESFEKWGKDDLLSDLVLIIRKFQPDVIVTRFPPDERAGHGHHTASAILAIEAFEKANDPKYLPKQVAKYGTWKTSSIYWNTSYWWDAEIQKIDLKEHPEYFVCDIGGYNALLGESYNEIGTLARSQHKCQGFGAILERGSRKEYFKHLGGEMIEKSFFEKAERNWTAIADKELEELFNSAISNFDFVNPENNVARLLSIKSKLEELKDSPFRTEKLNRCNEIILDCLGMYMEIDAEDYAFVNGKEVALNLSFINRSDLKVELQSVLFEGTQVVIIDSVLEKNQVFESEVNFVGSRFLSNPYWLNEPFDASFIVKDEANFGKPENDATLIGKVNLIIDGTQLSVNVPATHKWREPSFGERRRSLISVPRYTVNFENDLIILKPGEEKTIRLKVHSFVDSLDTQIKIKAPKGWTLDKYELTFSTANKHAETWLEVKVSAEQNALDGNLILKDKSGKELFQYREIAYDHIPTQAIFKPSTIDCKKLDVKINAGKIAYIQGIQDAVPEAIAQLGFEVELFQVADLSILDLSQFQTVVLGIRIYNVYPELFNFKQKLDDYVSQGGNVVMQYNTASRSFKTGDFGPKPFDITRNRVTEEDAEVKFVNPKHPLLNSPNQITKADFENWVQERGLYFADNWDDSYTPLFSWSDKGEEDVNGSIIIAKHGKGQFIYTGISFFRELPNGVMGAYRLFANLLSYPNE